MTLKQEVQEALGNWILETIENKGLATPEAIAALPEVAKVFLNYRAY